MTRLRSAYDALQQTSPVSAAPDPLIDAMQSGDRISYHPERAPEEIAHFHDVLQGPGRRRRNRCKFCPAP